MENIDLIDSQIDKSQIKTKERVRDLGEVYTNEREVKAMMDLLGDTGYQISARFLEPSCGNGNFLQEILDRKLSKVKTASSSSTLKGFEYNIIKAVSSIYGVDICIDNVLESRERLFNIIKSFYSYNKNTNIASDGFYESVKYVLSKNIILGDFINGEDKLLFSEFTNNRNFGKYSLVEKVFNIEQIKSDSPEPLKIYEPREYTELYYNTSKEVWLWLSIK